MKRSRFDAAATQTPTALTTYAGLLHAVDVTTAAADDRAATSLYDAGRTLGYSSGLNMD